MDFQGKYDRMDERGGSLRDRLWRVLCLAIRIGAFPERAAGDRSLLQSFDRDGVLHRAQFLGEQVLYV